MSHVPSAVPVNLYDLIPYLEETHREERVDLCQSLFIHGKLTFLYNQSLAAGQQLGNMYH